MGIKKFPSEGEVHVPPSTAPPPTPNTPPPRKVYIFCLTVHEWSLTCWAKIWGEPWELRPLGPFPGSATADWILNLAVLPFEEKAMSLVGIQPILMLFFPISSSLTVYKYVTAVSMLTCCLMELYSDRALLYIHVPAKQFINRINTQLKTYFTGINSQLKGK